MNPYDDSKRFQDTTNYLHTTLTPWINRVFDAVYKGGDGVYELGILSKVLTPKIKEPIEGKLKSIMDECSKQNDNINRDLGDALSERHKEQIIQKQALQNNQIATLNCMGIIIARLDELNLLIDYDKRMATGGLM